MPPRGAVIDEAAQPAGEAAVDGAPLGVHGPLQLAPRAVVRRRQYEEEQEAREQLGVEEQAHRPQLGVHVQGRRRVERHELDRDAQHVALAARRAGEAVHEVRRGRVEVQQLDRARGELHPHAAAVRPEAEGGAHPAQHDLHEPLAVHAVQRRRQCGHLRRGTHHHVRRVVLRRLLRCAGLAALIVLVAPAALGDGGGVEAEHLMDRVQVCSAQPARPRRAARRTKRVKLQRRAARHGRRRRTRTAQVKLQRWAARHGQWAALRALSARPGGRRRRRRRSRLGAAEPVGYPGPALGLCPRGVGARVGVGGGLLAAAQAGLDGRERLGLVCGGAGRRAHERAVVRDVLERQRRLELRQRLLQLRLLRGGERRRVEREVGAPLVAPPPQLVPS